MCMQNVNMNPVFCDVIPTADVTNLSLGNVNNKRFRVIEENGTRKIAQISLALFVSATQTKNSEDIERINPNTTFSMNSLYDVNIRLTETVSGKFMDLEEYLFDPSKYAVSECLCRTTLNHTKLFVFQDIELPQRQAKECFAIKVLIRCHNNSEIADKRWTVQAILPLKEFVELTKTK